MIVGIILLEGRLAAQTPGVESQYLAGCRWRNSCQQTVSPCDRQTLPPQAGAFAWHISSSRVYRQGECRIARL